MKLALYILDDTRKCFPSIAELTRQGVEVHAKRTGPDRVRYSLNGPAEVLNAFKVIARRCDLEDVVTTLNTEWPT